MPPRIDRTAPILNPFTVIIDIDEKKPYAFRNLRADQKQYARPIEVPIIHKRLKTGDYSIVGMEDCIVERKSKEDLYQSIGRRENFIGRLERMAEIMRSGGYCCVMVECDDSQLLIPPTHGKIHPKSISRTILAWRQRYPVDWYFASTRERAEVYTFRILERFYQDRTDAENGNS